MGKVYRTIAELLGRLTGTATDDTANLIRTSTLIGQITVFRTSRAGILRGLGWDDYHPDGLDQIRNILLRQVDVILDDAARN